MFRTALVSMVCVLSLAAFAFAADVAGRWQGTLYIPDGNNLDLLYTFQVDGEALTGSVSSDMGDTPIQDGKVTGDSISFRLDTDNGSYQNFGRVTGDSIYMVLDTGQGSLDYILTRAPAQ